jgi:hypothetical protein
LADLAFATPVKKATTTGFVRAKKFLRRQWPSSDGQDDRRDAAEYVPSSEGNDDQVYSVQRTYDDVDDEMMEDIREFMRIRGIRLSSFLNSLPNPASRTIISDLGAWGRSNAPEPLFKWWTGSGAWATDHVVEAVVKEYKSSIRKQSFHFPNSIMTNSEVATIDLDAMAIQIKVELPITARVLRAMLGPDQKPAPRRPPKPPFANSEKPNTPTPDEDRSRSGNTSSAGVTPPSTISAGSISPRDRVEGSEEEDAEDESEDGGSEADDEGDTPISPSPLLGQSPGTAACVGGQGTAKKSGKRKRKAKRRYRNKDYVRSDAIPRGICADVAATSPIRSWS